MPGWLADAFGTGIQQRALAEILLLSVACGPLGVWVVSFRQAYAAESLAHAMLPGLVIAVLIGAPLLAGGVGGLLVAAGAMALAARDERLGPDTAVAIAVTGLFGLGTMLALVPDVPTRLQEVLFGDLLGVTRSDVLAAAALAVGVAGALGALHRRLTAAAFDARPGPAAPLVLVLLAITTAVAVQGLGNLLVVALLIAPATAALAVTRRLVPALLLAAVFAMVAGLAGLLISFHAGVAAGASVALSAVILHLLCRLCALCTERLRRGASGAGGVAMVGRP